MKLYAVKINGLDAPVGISGDHVLLSWKVKESEGKKAVKQTVTVKEHDREVLTVNDAENTGTALGYDWKPRTAYAVHISVESDAGETAEAHTCFETGKMDEAWSGKWISTPEGFEGQPVFKKEFHLNGDIASGRLYITGLGLFEAHVNGRKAGEDYLAPFLNDYKEAFQYCVYDVTDLLKEDNEISVMLGNGWYRAAFGLSNASHYDLPFTMIAELHVSYDDGREDVMNSDASWQVETGVVTAGGIYDGEDQDWTVDVKTEKAVETEAPGKLTERYSCPLTVIEELPVKEVIHTPKGETVLDFGQNAAGFVEIHHVLSKGAKLHLEFGEILQEGCFYHDNYRTAKSDFTYVSDGKNDVIRPYFTFYGFRYVKVTCEEEIPAGDFTFRVLSSKMDRTGFFESGNRKVNRLHENTVWGMYSNFVDLPMDCPQRDERLGWCGDANVFARTAGYLADTRAFYDKFLKDLRSDQQRMGGRVAIYLPDEFPGMTGAVWSDIAAFLPDMLYDVYGSKEDLQRHYALMKDWVDCVYEQDKARGEKDLWDFGFQFGDWLALDGATEQSTFGRTDNYYVSSAYYYASTLFTAKAAEVLGLEEADAYQKRAERILRAIRKEYFTESGRLAVDTQTGYLITLRFGLAEDPERMKKDLRERIQKDCRKIKGGFVGATMMNTVLADSGMTDLAYDFLFYEGFPGWLYEVNLGATTIWERWNSVLPDGRLSGTSMNSLNHYSFGSVCEFLYKHAAGIQMTSPGFRTARIAPKVDVRLGHVNCSFDSAYGRYVSNWNIEENGSLTFHIEVPFSCEADIVLPEQETIHAAAGAYDYVIRTEKDYRCLYTENTAFRDLLKDERAVGVIQKHLPSLIPSLDQKDEEAMSKGLFHSRLRSALFRMPTDSFDAAIAELKTVLYKKEEENV